MLNIMIMNCDDVFCEYEWESKEEFLNDMESDKEKISILDNAVISMDTENKSYNEENLKDIGIYTVADLVGWCKNSEF